MVHNLQRLIYLCQIKNDLNRKRRRFYYYMNHDWSYTYINNKYQWAAGDKPEKHITRWHARRGYRKAQRDMKAMTKEMREMRIEMGARLEWGESGNILAILYQGKRLHAGLFKDYYEAELFEMGFFK